MPAGNCFLSCTVQQHTASNKQSKMVWFTCDVCCDTIKKPKLINHFRSCHSHSFTCVDCCQTFDRNSVKNHSTCVTEHEKYALGATKPGGFAANGLSRDAPTNNKQAAANDSDPAGLEFLSKSRPFRCSVCNVTCTSWDTLLAHASGVKHKRRVRAVTSANGNQQDNTAAQQQQSVPEQANGNTNQEPLGSQDIDSQQENGTKTAHNSFTTLLSNISEDKFSKLTKVVSRKLKVKGKVGPKKLRKLSIKKLGLEEKEVNDALLTAIREKLTNTGAARTDGDKLLPVQ